MKLRPTLKFKHSVLGMLATYPLMTQSVFAGTCSDLNIKVHEAALRGDSGAVSSLLQSHPSSIDVNCIMPQRLTPAYVESSPLTEGRTLYPRTPLQAAAMSGSVEILQLLAPYKVLAYPKKNEKIRAGSLYLKFFHFS